MHPVRSITAALLSLSLTVYAFADDAAMTAPADSSLAELTFVETVETHGRREAINTICRSSRDVKGCTDFPVERLTCDCELHGNRWAIHARAEVHAVIHLSSRYATKPVLEHERLHLVDLDRELREHLGRIASKAWESESACRTYADVLTRSPHLRVVMNGIREASNDKYGCSRGVVY